MIPTYNRAGLLAGAIESVLAQSYGDFEIIVVDDGSTEDIRAVAAKYGERVRYARIEHAGPAAARNAGMQMARGEFLCLLDSDDLYYPHKLALQVDYFDRHPDTVMVYTDFSAFDDQGFFEEFHLKTYHRSAYRNPECAYETLFRERTPLSRNAMVRLAARVENAPHWVERSEYRGDLYEAYLYNIVVFTNSMMFRRDVLATTGLQQPYFGHFHDLEFALRICRVGTVAFIDNPTYKLRYHPGQVSTTRTPQGGLTSVDLQRGLLRVARVHACEPRYYERHRDKVNQLVTRLARAAAMPMIAYGGPSRHLRRYLPRRARPYLALSARHGDRALDLYLVSYLPAFGKRVYFHVRERWKRRKAPKGAA
jgi:glycosyltransferase involved in cell wall biosynthesis